MSRARDSGLEEDVVDARARGELRRGVAGLRAPELGQRDVRAAGVGETLGALGLAVADEDECDGHYVSTGSGTTQRRSSSAAWIASSSACTRSPSRNEGSAGAPSRIEAWKLRATCAKASFELASKGPSD